MIVPSIVQDRRALEALCERVRGAERVAIDTEFHAERTYSPRLMVVQLAFEAGRYQALLRHYGLQGQSINPTKSHENGDVEQSHRQFKRALDQAFTR